MMKQLMTILFITTALASCSLFGSGQGDDHPEIPGKIVFSAKDDAGTNQIYSMNTSGSDLEQLTFFKNGHDAVQPSWSPDGQQIIFSSFKYGTSIGPALWVMNADGSDQHVLYDSEPDNPEVPPLSGNYARWSPDGTKIVFDLCLNCQIETNNDIYVFDISTDSVTQLTEHSGSDINPDWSPDGSHIIFQSDRDYVDADTLRFRKDLYIMNADGTNLQRLTHTGNAMNPTWSPSGQKIAYEWNIQGNNVFIYQITSEQTIKVETGLEFTGNPIWNKQGTELLVFGRETEQSQPEMRLIKVKDGASEILHAVTLNEKAIGKDYDWYINQN